MPAAWTDWRNADVSPNDSDIDHTSSIGKLDDLLQLRKVVDALLSPACVVGTTHGEQPSS